MRSRSFTAKYEDRRVKRPDCALQDAMSWFLSDMAAEMRPTTLAGYRSHLSSFLRAVEPKTLQGLTPDNVEANLRTIPNLNYRMGRAIALKSFAKYLAKRKLWYEGNEHAPLSVLRDVRQPRPSGKGQPGYREEELRVMLRAVDEGLNRRRNVAVLAVELHGFRAKEARLLMLRNCVMPKYDEIQGEFLIESEEATKGGTAGVRSVPMEPFARDAIRNYLRLERPEYHGSGQEPLFLTGAGGALTATGWTSMARRLKARIAEQGIHFKQHRLRSTRAQQLHRAGWPELAIMDTLGWSSPAMLRRYVGRIALSHLKELPTTLDKLRLQTG
jgi:integrase